MEDLQVLLTLFFIFFLWTFLFHSLQFSSKLPETWHIYVKIPCADSNHLRFWKFLLEKKVMMSKYLRSWKSPKKLSPKLGKLFEFCLRESNRALAEMKIWRADYRTYDTSLWCHINFYDVIPIFWHFVFHNPEFSSDLRETCHVQYKQAVTISDFGNSS